MKRLCVAPDEEQLVLRAFAGLKNQVTEEPLVEDSRNAIVERERVERWLEARTQAITFKNAVARELEKAGISYRRDFCEGIASADFLIERARARIAFECKFNVGRDFEKTVGIARLLLDLLRCDRVVVIVPFRDETSANSISDYPQISISTPSEAVQALLA